MSQFFQGVTSGSLPPSVPTSFGTDLNDPTVLAAAAAGGSVTAVANVIRMAGDNGIKTAQTSESGDLQIRFIRGQDSTTDDETITLITQAIPTDSTLTIQIIVAGFASDNSAIGAYGTAVVKNVAGVASLVDDVDLIVNKEAALAAANITVTTSGSDLLVNVLGVAGLNINWGAALPGIVLSS